jgi:hypothetical protein
VGLERLDLDSEGRLAGWVVCMEEEGNEGKAQEEQEAVLSR